MRYESIELARAKGREINLVNQAYAIWHAEHSLIAAQGGVELKSESFHRCHTLHVIHDKGLVLSMTLSSFLNLQMNGVEKLKYFEPTPTELIHSFCERTPKIMTVEWITLHPKEKGKFSKIRQPDLILGCAVKAFALSDADMSMGFSRTDLSADRIAMQFGYEGEGLVDLMKIECRVMRLTKEKIKPHRFAIVQNAIDGLWSGEFEHQRVA